MTAPTHTVLENYTAFDEAFLSYTLALEALWKELGITLPEKRGQLTLAEQARSLWKANQSTLKKINQELPLNRFADYADQARVICARVDKALQEKYEEIGETASRIALAQKVRDKKDAALKSIPSYLAEWQAQSIQRTKPLPAPDASASWVKKTTGTAVGAQGDLTGVAQAMLQYISVASQAEEVLEPYKMKPQYYKLIENKGLLSARRQDVVAAIKDGNNDNIDEVLKHAKQEAAIVTSIAEQFISKDRAAESAEFRFLAALQEKQKALEECLDRWLENHPPSLVERQQRAIAAFRDFVEKIKQTPAVLIGAGAAQAAGIPLQKVIKHCQEKANVFESSNNQEGGEDPRALFPEVFRRQLVIAQNLIKRFNAEMKAIDFDVFAENTSQYTLNKLNALQQAANTFNAAAEACKEAIDKSSSLGRL